MGRQIGHGVRFGAPVGIVLAGEGVETVLSLRRAFPALPMIAALSAAHLGALDLPPGTRRLLIARDGDPAGWRAAARLRARAEARGIRVCLTRARAVANSLRRAQKAARGDLDHDTSLLADVGLWPHRLVPLRGGSRCSTAGDVRLNSRRKA